MRTQIVMDMSGDTRHHFDPADALAVAEAEKRFVELTGSGFIAAKRTGNGTSELIRHFVAGLARESKIAMVCDKSELSQHRNHDDPVDLFQLMSPTLFAIWCGWARSAPSNSDLLRSLAAASPERRTA